MAKEFGDNLFEEWGISLLQAKRIDDRQNLISLVHVSVFAEFGWASFQLIHSDKDIFSDLIIQSLIFVFYQR